MRTRDIMHTEVLTTFPGECLTDVATRMRDQEVGPLVVMADSGEFLGVVKGRDLVRAMADGRAPHVTTVATWMSPDSVIVAPDDDIRRAAELMVRHGIRHLPVVERESPSVSYRLATCCSRKPSPLRCSTRSTGVGRH